MNLQDQEDFCNFVVDFATSSSWSHEYNMLTNRKFLGFYVSIVSYITTLLTIHLFCLQNFT